MISFITQGWFFFKLENHFPKFGGKVQCSVHAVVTGAFLVSILRSEHVMLSCMFSVLEAEPGTI